MALVCSVFLFALACNLDTLVLGIGFGARGTAPTLRGCLILAAVTSVITALALWLGGLGGGLFPPLLARKAGGLFLVGIGLWMLLDYLKSWDAPAETFPAQGDYLPLAAALAFNNAGAGLAAGVGGMPALLGGGANCVVTVLLLPLGLILGHRLRNTALAKFAVPLSGALILMLGAFQFQG